MLKIIVTSIGVILTIICNAQQYEVIYDTEYINRGSVFEVEVVTYSVQSNLERVNINGNGQTTILGQPNNLIVSSYYLDIDNFGDDVTECGTNDQRLSLTSNNCYSFGRTNFRTECAGLVDFNITVRPILSLIGGTSSAGSYCQSDEITLKASPGFGSGNYKWQYRISGGQWENTTLSTGNTLRFNMSDLFGSNLQVNYNKNINFRYSVGNCSYTTAAAVSGTYRFNPDSPIVTSTDITGVACKDDRTWEIAITGTNRSPATNEIFEYSLFSGPSSTSTLHSSTRTSTLSSTAHSPIGLPAGTYYILTQSFVNGGTSASSCGTEQLIPVTVTEPNIALSIGTPSKTDETCRSSNDGTVTINATGGWSGGYSYSINSTTSYQSSNSFTSLSAGTYTMRVKDSEGCVSPTSVSINQPTTTLSVPLPSVSNESCRSSNDGTITITPSGGWGKPYYYRIKRNGGSWSGWTSSSDNNFIYTRGAGTYSVDVKDKSSGGCLISHTGITISEPTGELSIGTPAKSNVTCRGASDGIVTINASSGWGSYAYSLNSTTNYQSGNTFSGLSNGSYTVRVKDGGGCIKSATVSITQPANNLAHSTTKTETCFGVSAGTITVTASGGWGNYEYSKDNGSTYQSSNVFNGLSGGNYNVMIRDAEGCTTTSTTVNITQPASALSFSTTKSDATCRNSASGTIAVTASGGWGNYEYSANGGLTYQSSSTFTNLLAGTYDIRIRDAESCESNVTTVTITEPSTGLSFTTSSEQVSCQGSSDGMITITASGGWGSIEFSIDDGSTYQSTGTYSNLPPGLYRVRVSDDGGCETAREDVIISEPTNALRLTIDSQDIICKGESNGSLTLNATGGWGNYQYSIDDGTTYQSGNQYSNLLPGEYTIKVRDAELCETVLVNLTIAEPSESLSLSLNKTDVSCFGGNDGEISGLASGGWGNYEYSLDGTNYQTSSMLTNLSEGSYTVYVRDANGCIDQSNITITEPPVLTGNVIREQDATCSELNGEAELNITGGTTPYSYSWTNTSGDVVGTEAILRGVGGGVYTATITDGNGCVITRTANVSSEDGAVVTTTASTATSCFNSADGEATISVSGVAPFTMVWSSGEVGATANQLIAGDNVVTVTDANGCVVVEVITINAPEVISYNVTALQKPTCHDSTDGSLTITAQGGVGGFTYNWETGSTNTVLTNIAQGTYELTITDANGCSLTDQVILPGVEPITVDGVAVTSPSCVGNTDGSLSVEARGGNGNYTYEWGDGSTGTQLINVGAGDYEVVVTDEKGCVQNQIISIEQPDEFVIDMGGTVEICVGAAYEASYPLPNATYSWTSDNGFASTEETVILNEPGTYTLEVTNADRCFATDSFELITSDDLLNADFLMVSEGYVGDTIVLVDISWPIPENVSWGLPENVEVVEQTNDFVQVIFNENGTYSLDLEVGLDDCRDFYSQSITIVPASEKSSTNGRIGNEVQELIQVFKVYPNPSDGSFDVDLEFTQISDFSIQLIHLSGNKRVVQQSFKETNKINIPFNLDVETGLYLMLLEVGSESKAKRIIIK